MWWLWYAPIVAFALWFYRRYLYSDYVLPVNPTAAVPAVRVFTGRELPVVSPCTGQTVAVERCATAEEVKDVVQRARVAQTK